MITTGSLITVIMLCLFGCTDLNSNDKNHEHEIDALQRIENRDRLSEQQIREFQGCNADSDCIYVNNGCCDCANGGKETAVNKSKVDAFKNALICSNTSCTERGRVRPCGSGHTKCENNLCIFIPADAALPQTPVTHYVDPQLRKQIAQVQDSQSLWETMKGNRHGELNYFYIIRHSNDFDLRDTVTTVQISNGRVSDRWVKGHRGRRVIDFHENTETLGSNKDEDGRLEGEPPIDFDELYSVCLKDILIPLDNSKYYVEFLPNGLLKECVSVFQGVSDDPGSGIRPLVDFQWGIFPGHR